MVPSDCVDIAATTALARNAAGVVMHTSESHDYRALARHVLRQGDLRRWVERERYGLELCEFLIGLAARHVIGAPSPRDGSMPAPRRGRPLREWLRDLERDELIDALARARGNVTRAAEDLGIKRTALHERVGAMDLWDHVGRVRDGTALRYGDGDGRARRSGAAAAAALGAARAER